MNKPLQAKSAAKPADNSEKRKAMEAVLKADDGPLKRLPVDVPSSWHRRLKSMSARSTDGVPIRLFIIEAISDLFDKYDAGKGKYEIDSE